MRLAIAALGMGVLAGLASAQDRPNRLTAVEASEGWILLFDGKSLDGWEPHAGGDFKVEDGAISCPGTTAGWISTSRSFSDYALKLEFRGAAKVNSGVFLRSAKEGQPHVTGYELQIWDYQPAGYNTGSLVGSAKASATKVLGDQWNRFEITAVRDHFVITLNGERILDTHDSKHSAGVIGFQCQKDNRIEFRSIKVRPVGK